MDLFNQDTEIDTGTQVALATMGWPMVDQVLLVLVVALFFVLVLGLCWESWQVSWRRRRAFYLMGTTERDYHIRRQAQERAAHARQQSNARDAHAIREAQARAAAAIPNADEVNHG